MKMMKRSDLDQPVLVDQVEMNPREFSILKLVPKDSMKNQNFNVEREVVMVSLLSYFLYL